MKKIVSIVAIIIPVIAFFYLFFAYTVNAPINDDYQAVLDFLNKCISTDSITEKLKLIFSQHNEHRIVYDRIWIILSYKFFGDVNFNFLALIGNFSLIGILLVYLREFILTKKKLWAFIPISVLIFNISSWENMTFAMAVLSNVTVLLFIILSLRFIANDTLKKQNFIASYIFFILAVFTQGAGLFLLPISLLILFYKKEYKNMCLYLVLSLPIIVFYFYNFQKHGDNTLLLTLFDFKVRSILFVFAFLGNGFNYFLIFTNETQDSLIFTTIIGFCLFLLFIYITKKQYYKKNIFNYSIMLFFILSAFLTSYSRVSLGLETAGASRYRINGLLFFVSIYIWFVETYPIDKKKYTYAILGATSFYFLFFNLRQYEYLSYREKQTYRGIALYEAGKYDALNGDKNLLELYKKIIEESEQLGTYQFPMNDVNAYFPMSQELSKKTLSDNTDLYFTNRIETLDELNDSYLIEGLAFLDTEGTSDQIVYLGIKNPSDDTIKFYFTKQIPKFDLNPWYKKFNLQDGGFIARIPKKSIKKGENKIWTAIEVGGKIKISETDKTIIL